MKPREYLRLKREIEERSRADLKALNRVWQMSGAGAVPSAGSREGASESRTRGRLLTAARAAIKEIQGDLTQQTVRSKIQEMDPVFGITVKRASLSSALRRLAHDGELELVSAGSGKRQSVYKSRL